MTCNGTVTDSQKGLANVLLSLEEPWRSRFLSLIASRAVVPVLENCQQPSRIQVETLLCDLELYREIKLLLDTWTGAETRTAQ